MLAAGTFPPLQQEGYIALRKYILNKINIWYIRWNGDGYHVGSRWVTPGSQLGVDVTVQFVVDVVVSIKTHNMTHSTIQPNQFLK